jgi:RNA polymerase-binding transcription factor DksA
VNIEHYKDRLLEVEGQIAGRLRTETSLGREQAGESVRDTADASVADEAASEDFTEAELDSTVLQQVRDALKRIESGTFGQCVVDGEAIEANRLDAVPWTPYCLKHQQLLEASEPIRTPTL